jgi:type I restriction enzyme, S subunit
MQGTVPYWGAGGIIDSVSDSLFNEPLVLLGEDGAPFFEAGRDVAFLLDGPAWVNNHIHVLRPNRLVDRRFLCYALNTVDYSAYITGSTRDKLTQDEMWSIRVPFPSSDLQVEIADYLDGQTARIDSLIEAKQQLVDLLSERESALATHLLLGPPARGGPAGPGQVTLRPGWTFVPFRRLFREVDLRSATGSETLLSVSQTRGVIRQSELGERRQYAETLVGYKLCEPGDLVVNRMWVYYGALGTASMPGIVSPDYAVFRPTGDMSSEFAAYVLRTPAYVGEMTRLVRGIGAAFQGAVRKPRLHPSELGLINMPSPPSSNQQDLLGKLDKAVSATSRRASLIEKSIALLREHRQALITAAITGQIEVPKAA